MLAREPRVQPPSLESYSDMPLFNTKAVVHQTGVPAPTLRAWERRYGILTPRRGDNDYRLYSERDIAIVTWLRERVTSGMTISQAIALLHTIEPAHHKGHRGKRRSVGAPLTDIQTAAPLQYAATEPAPTRFDLTELKASLLSNLLEFDEYAANRTIGHALAVHRIEDVCLSLFTPTLEAIGDMWASGKVSSATEHFATSVIRAQLESLYRSAAADDSGPLLLVGCAPAELHELGALMLALFLRRTGQHVVYLGQNLEIEGLLATIAAKRPVAVLLSASLPERFEALREVGSRLSESGGAKAQFIFGGQMFTRQPELARGIPGEFLNLDASEAASLMRRKFPA